MSSKDRPTLVLCVNATGSCKVPSLLIGTAANPHCFRNERCPIPYTNQSKAWVDKEKYRQWWSEIFLPAARAHAKKGEKIALLLDNFSGHDQLVTDPEEQVDVFFFPPNLTSIYQPLDQGIISILKTKVQVTHVSRVGECIRRLCCFSKKQLRLREGELG